MNILLRAGEYLWSARGIHVVDEKGFAVTLSEDTEIEIDDDMAPLAWSIIKFDRELRNMDPETGLPQPVPEPQPEPVPEPEPEILSSETLVIEDMPNP